ncbi:Complement C1q tumor necrosis factor-related protein 3 [Mactra antiquata]
MKPLKLVVPFVLFAFAMSKKESGGGRRERNRHSGRGKDLQDEADISGLGQCELEITCKGDTSTQTKTPVKLPIKGPRGPPGRPGEKGEPGQAGKDGVPGTPGEPGKSARTLKHVAFFAGLGFNQGPVDENTDLILEKVITNVGGGYDGLTGRFTAPFSGLYHFTIVVAAQGRQKAAVMLMNNGTMVETIWAESIPYWATSSNTAILNLASGDQVWLVLLKRAPFIHGYMYSSFSGYSLFEIEDDNKNDIKLDDSTDDNYVDLNVGPDVELNGK